MELWPDHLTRPKVVCNTAGFTVVSDRHTTTDSSDLQTIIIIPVNRSVTSMRLNDRFRDVLLLFFRQLLLSFCLKWCSEVTKPEDHNELSHVITAKPRKWIIAAKLSNTPKTEEIIGNYYLQYKKTRVHSEWVFYSNFARRETDWWQAALANPKRILYITHRK